MTVVIERNPPQLSDRATDARARGVVWLFTFVLIALGLAYVAVYGRNAPIGDDFNAIAPAVGDAPLGPWLWAEYHGHRLPLTKLIYFASLKLTHFDFRTLMFLSVLVLGSLSLMMIETARRVRGGAARYTDLFFPLVMLHGGHAGNLLIAFRFNLVFPAALTCVCMLIALRERPGLKLATVLLLLFLCGGFGFPFLVTYGFWLVYADFHRDPQSNSSRRTNIVLGISTLILVSVYLILLAPTIGGPSATHIGASLTTALQTLAMCFGTAAKKIWMASGPSIGIFTLLIALSMGWLCLRAWKRLPAEHARATGLLAFLMGLFGLALVIGLSRADQGPLAGLQARYVTLATPLLCCAYFVAELYLSANTKRLALRALFALAVALFIVHIKPGINFGRGEAIITDQFLGDIRRGVARDVLLDRYVPGFAADKESLNRDLDRLHKAGVEPY